MTQDRTLTGDQDLADLTRTLASLGANTGVRLEPGTRCGRYRLVGELGRGGMGAVYLADQTEPVQRRVAIKLSPSRHARREDRVLFEIERQALARMNHPAIAQLYDAGTTDDGTPYFVMEHVEGERITAHARSRGLDVPARVELMRQVRLGVAHAHDKGLIHCDLKPGNLLAAMVDGATRPKVIDFGIARALRSGAGVGYAGTPAYMSPEQARGDPDLDTRTDVYSLGLVLFELLAGRPAAEVEGWSATNGAPSLPASIGIATARRHELDAILARATAPDREQRYASSRALAEDLGRWLERQPIAALPATRGYRVACFLRRHALAAGIAAIAVLALVSGLAGTTLGLVEATAQREAAEARERELEMVVGFQQRLLGGLDARHLGPTLLTELRARVDQAAEGGELGRMPDDLPMVDATRAVFRYEIFEPASTAIGHEFGDAPRTAARLRTSLGHSLSGLALFTEAERELDAALAAFEALGDRDSRARVEVEIARASLDRQADRLIEAEQRLAALEDRMGGAYASDGPLQAEYRLVRALVAADRGRPQDSVDDFAAAAAGFRAQGLVQRAIETEATGLVFAMVASSRCNLAEQAQARRLDDEAQTAGLDSNRLPSLLRAVALCDMARGAVRAVARNHGLFVDMQRRISGDDDPSVQMQRAMTLLLRTISGEPGLGLESELIDAEALATRLAGAETTYAVFPRIARGELLSRLGREEEALALLRDLDRRLPETPDVHPTAAMMTAGYLGLALARIDRPAEAEEAVERARATCVSMLGEAYADCLLYPIALARDRAERDPAAWPSGRLAALLASTAGVFSEGSPYPIVVGWLLRQALVREGGHDEAARLLDGPLRALAIPDPEDVSLDDAPYVIALREALAPQYQQTTGGRPAGPHQESP